MKARDQRIPEQTGQGIVTLSVLKDGSTPYFVNEPYRVNISASQPEGSAITVVEARDDTLTVSTSHWGECDYFSQ